MIDKMAIIGGKAVGLLASLVGNTLIKSPALTMRAREIVQEWDAVDPLKNKDRQQQPISEQPGNF